MGRYKFFLRWWIIFVFMVLSFVFSYYSGAIETIVKKDTTYLCIVIWLLSLVTTIDCGFKTFKISKYTSLNGCFLDKNQQLVDVGGFLDFGGFSAAISSSLGLLGTIVGFIIAMSSDFAKINISDVTATQKILGQLSNGIAIALYTTLVGLIGAIFTQVQYFNLEKAIKNK